MADGQLLSRTECFTDARRGAAAVIDTVLEAIRALAASLDRVSAIGIACAGQIHPATGTVVYAPNLDWRDVPLGADLSRALGVPVAVENDVRAAAWGEFRWRQRERPDVTPRGSLVAVFVGTGIGSGAVIDGTLWRGAGNAAGEIGHTQVLPGGRPCPRGQSGCLEQYAAGAGFQRRFAEALAAGIPTVLTAATGGDPSRLTALMVAEAAAADDPFAREVWQDAERYLTMGVANYVTLVNPHDLVLGGGVLESVPRLFDVVADGVLRLTTIMARASLRIDRARLGDWSGVVGAALLSSEGASTAPSEPPPGGGAAAEPPLEAR